MRSWIRSHQSPSGRIFPAAIFLFLPVSIALPAEDGPKAPPRSRERQITDADRAHWSFRPLADPPVPAVRQAEWVANPIDAFVLAKLEAAGLEPNRPAAPRELVRRAWFDLVGLPPSPEEVEAFERDPSPASWKALVERLLALPQYGERWGRHWLDIVRYAETNGYERDGEKPLAWRYRDYVIASLNEDKPYDRFVREQLAGDELEEFSPAAVVATGFYRLGVWDDEPDDGRMAEFDGLDDVVRTTGAAFLGLTLGCARCHDHKFDPIPQEDYYRFLSFFHNLQPYTAAAPGPDAPSFLPLAPPSEVARFQEERGRRVRALEERIEALRAPVRERLLRERAGALNGAPTERSRKAEVKPEEVEKALDERSRAEKKRLDADLARARSEPFACEFALAARERGTEAPRTHVLVRGSAAQPGAEVEPAFPAVLGGERPAIAPRARPSSPAATATSSPASMVLTTSGRRQALAEWIASEKNPLTARVMANRVWGFHFGQGIVRTPDDFGRAGIPPSHPELLDWLARELIRGGWRLKSLHETILLSSTYRMSSRVRDEKEKESKAEEIDPANTLVWRRGLRRLEGESIRDSVLAVSGTLSSKMGGRGVFPRLSGEVVAGQSRPGLDWEISTPEEQNRRSIYLFVKRTLRVPLLETFDYGNTDTPQGQRSVTTVAPQALMLFNSDWMLEKAAALAARLRARAGEDLPKQVALGYSLALQRRPTEAETRIALEFIERQRRGVLARPPSLSFRPEAPSALENGYLHRLSPRDFLSGPARGWEYSRGSWLDRGEGISWVDPQRGPHALFGEIDFVDGAVEGRFLLHRNSQLASILLRAKKKGETFTGYEILLDPENGAVVVRRHGEEVKELARAILPIATESWLAARVELDGPRLRVLITAAGAAVSSATLAPLLEVTDPKPLEGPGRLGIRTWGAPLSIENLVLRAGGKETHLQDPPAGASDGAIEERAGREALEAFSLLLLNLNEFVYVD